MLRSGPLAAAVVLWIGIAQADGAPPFDPGHSGVHVEIGGEVWPYRLASGFVLPGAPLPIVPRGAAGLELRALSGELRPREDGGWIWTAPAEPGPVLLSLWDGPRELVRIQAFVMRPAVEVRGDHLNGYRIGRYPPPPSREGSRFRPPEGFVEVLPEMESLPVSPHLRLGQFVCKQEGGYPRYLVLRARLLLKLERILEELGAAGLRLDTLTVMSGYRTPWYNRELGNVAYSQHLWGGAADIFVDAEPRDGRMDDLDGDGRVDRQDARWLADRIRAMQGALWYRPFLGGLASYEANEFHGPFVHVDVRGRAARWEPGATHSVTSVTAQPGDGGDEEGQGGETR